MTHEAGDAAAVAWQALPDGIVVADAAGAVLAANPAAVRALGGSAATALGGSLATLLVARDGADMAGVVRAGRDGGWTGEVALRGAEATAGPWELALAPLTVEGQPPGIVGVLRDLGARHAREREGAQLLSTVLHDVKGPLTVILGYAELLTDPSEAASRDRLLDTLNRIADSGEQIHALISNYGLYSRIQTGRLPMDRRPVDLVELIDRAVEQYGPRAARKGVAMAVECGELPAVPGDRTQLDRALWNVVANAIKFTPPGGQVVVRGAAAGDVVTITVEDTGPGVDESERDRVFAKHAAGKPTRKGEGVGLGLAVARAVVRAHGGDVIATAGPDGGAVFTLRLPVPRGG